MKKIFALLAILMFCASCSENSIDDFPDVPGSSEIWYTNDSATEPTEPNKPTAFGANIISNAYDVEKACWVIKFDGTVTKVGDWAFYTCENLTSITLPESVTKIGEGAFRDCASLTNLYCKAATPPTLGINAFYNTVLSYIYVPAKSVNTYKISTNWRYYAENIYGYNFVLDKMVVPDAAESTKPASNELWYTCLCTPIPVEPYDPSAFDANIISNIYDADNKRFVITFDDVLTTIGTNAFYDNMCLHSITMSDSVTTIGFQAFAYCNNLESVDFGNGITTIGENAFSNCHAIEDITLPKSLDEIGVAAFWECENLTEVTIPYNVTNIGVNAFGNYIKNFNGNFATKDGRCLIVDNSLVCFANACGVTKYTIPDNATTIKKDVIRCNSLTEITIPNSVTTIENGAFFSCSNIERFNGKFATNDGKCLIVNDNLAAFAQGCGATEYEIPFYVTTIGSHVFHANQGLTNITIPNSVTTIEDCAFSFCSGLTNITIPDSVITIEQQAFRNCYGLTSVVIPPSVKYVDSVIFVECTNLSSVYCQRKSPPGHPLGYPNYPKDMFLYNAPDRKIYVPTESVDVYKAALGWSEYADAIVGYDF